MISTSEFRKGSKIEYKGDPYEVIDFQHVKMGRGGAIVRTKMKNLRTGSIIEDTFKGGEKLETPNLEERSMQFLYIQDDMYFFMDTGTYEQFPLSPDQLGDSRKFLKDNMVVKVLYYGSSPLTVELPIFVKLEIAKTAPGVKGDTASGGSKPAVMETGVTIKVPFHLNEGDIIKIDTRTSEYVERVK
ncbi:MAG TPA: elongation factor P [Nitrospirae bacterium]|nr:elongation factor P [bacterium BMS3Abin10]GBE39032.1 elongation factor P [bacterium BMS3Bbin08]HDH50012.1 elongation factor P [Nitrospirota bacterium]HDK17040.1 elongation factor P [Nitrospirota bacterium]HDK41595.1 elongation factor P [Nitrospirota bacterium]